MSAYTHIQDIDLASKRVFVRVDFNVPLKREGDTVKVGDDTRIRGALPTIRHIIENGGTCILASHLGRPGGKVDPKYSLEPVGERLSELLGSEVVLSEDCAGDGPRGLSHNLGRGQILLLENVRFDPGETTNDPKFSAKLAELCDVYINDAFGTLHRAHASTAGITPLVKQKGIGFLVQKELEYLAPLRENPERPFVLVMGGAKVSDKMGIMEHFLSKVDAILIGGAMAYAFLKAKGYGVGKSLCSEEQVTLAKRLIKSAEARDIRLFLPVDHTGAESFDDEKVTHIDGSAIPDHLMALDIGPETVDLFSEPIATAKTIFWNGPLGVFEKPQLSAGTFGIAKAIAESPARKLAGGGDVAAALAASGKSEAFDFVSTGGGATLEYLEGKTLPGLKALELPKNLSYEDSGE